MQENIEEKIKNLYSQLNELPAFRELSYVQNAQLVIPYLYVMTYFKDEPELTKVYEKMRIWFVSILRAIQESTLTIKSPFSECIDVIVLETKFNTIEVTTPVAGELYIAEVNLTEDQVTVPSYYDTVSDCTTTYLLNPERLKNVLCIYSIDTGFFTFENRFFSSADVNSVESYKLYRLEKI